MQRLIIICGPSGVGKGTIIRELLALRKDIFRCPSVTTRPLRAGEKDGLDYFFCKKKEFLALKRQNKILGDSPRQFSYYYGIRADDLVRALNTGRNVLVETNLGGISSLRAAFSHTIVIFILPPSLEALERRLQIRGTEGRLELAKRMTDAKRMLRIVKYLSIDHFVVNDDLESSVRAVLAIVEGPSPGLQDSRVLHR